MADNEASVRIVGEASAGPAIEETKTQVTDLSEVLMQLTAGFEELSTEIRASMAGGAASTAEMASEMKVLIEETEKESLSLKSVAVSAREGAEAMIGMREAVMGFGDLILAAFAVEEIAHFAESIGEAAEKTFHLSQQLGLTMAQTQGLNAAAAATGVSFDALTKGIGLLDKKFETNPKLFRDLGILIPQNADQMTILAAVMDKFERTADGPNKAALALTLMSRSGKELIPFLNEGSAGLQELIEKANEYGAVNVDAAEKGVKLAESMNESKLAMTGLKLTLSDAFAPLLTELTDGFNNMVAALTASYREGGAVKIIFEGIVDLFEGLGEVVGAIKLAFVEAFGGMGVGALDWSNIVKGVIEGVVLVFKLFLAAIVGVADLFKAAFEQMAGQLVEWYGQASTTFSYVGLAIDVLKQAFITLGTVVYDALTLKWGSIAADWDAGMAQIDGVVKARGAQIVADAKATHDQAAGWFAAAQNTGAGYGDFLTNLFKQQEAPKPTGIKLPKTGTEGGGDLSKAGKTEKRPKDDLVAQLDAELTARKLAWAMAQDAQDSAQAYSLQSEADYWKEALSRADLSAKDRAGIETKYLAAHSQLVKEQIQAVIDGYRIQLDAAKGDSAARLTIATQEADFVKQKFGEKSHEYKQAEDQIVQITREAAQQQRQIEDELAQHQEKMAEQRINEELAQSRFRVAMGVETNAELIKDEIAAENRRWAAEDKDFQREIAAASADKARHQKLLDDKAVAEAAYQSKITALERQAVLQRTQIERTAITSTASLWGQNIAKLITLQQGFAATLHSLYVGMVGIVSNALAQILENWLVKHITTLLLGTAASKASGAAEIGTASAIAGANGVASMAGAPWPMDMTAPAFGAEMALAAGLYGARLAVPSGAGGIYDVAGGLTMLHENEMVLPAWAAHPLRSMLSGGSSGSPPGATGPGDGGGGGQNITNHFHGPTNKAEIERWFLQHSNAVAKAADKAGRNGFRPKSIGS